MSKLTVYVGLDYHKDSIQVCIMDASGAILANRPCPNDAAAVAGLVARHGDAVQAALEASTGTAHLADELANRHGWSVHQAHPGYVARLKQSPDKSDWADARLLADLVRVGYLPRVWLAPEALRQLRLVVRYRQQLVERRRAAKQRAAAVLREHRVAAPGGARWTKRFWAWARAVPLPEQARWVLDRHLEDLERIAEQIGQAEGRLRQLLAADPLVTRLRTLPGVGEVTAWVLRAEVGQFDRFRTGKQLARYCGLSPRNASSGQRQADAGLIKAGAPSLRATLVEAAHRLIRHDPRWSALASRLRGSGKPTCVVVAAVANRFVRWLYHQVKEVPMPQPA